MFSPLVLLHLMTATMITKSATNPTAAMTNHHQSGKPPENIKNILDAAFCSVKNPVAKREEKHG